jgi:hypothetical protein
MLHLLTSAPGTKCEYRHVRYSAAFGALAEVARAFVSPSRPSISKAREIATTGWRPLDMPRHNQPPMALNRRRMNLSGGQLNQIRVRKDDDQRRQENQN